MKHVTSYLWIVMITCMMHACSGQPKSDEPTQVDRLPADAHDMVPYIQPKDFDSYFRETAHIYPPAPAHITRNILQDQQGNLWFATFEGISHFDGSSFVNHTNKEGLRRYRAFSLLEDRHGQLWFGTIGAGIYRYDGTFFNITTADGLVHNDVGCIYEDQQGAIWFGTRVGISRYNGSTFSNFTTEEGLTDNDINAIIEDTTGRLWIGTRGAACWWDGTSFTPIQHDQNQVFLNTRSIIRDQRGDMWLGGNAGLWRWRNGTFTQISTEFTGYIYEDHQGHIWTSSEEMGERGVWKLSQYHLSTLYSDTPKATTVLKEENMFFGILEDDQGQLWLGHLFGIYRYDGASFVDFKE